MMNSNSLQQIIALAQQKMIESTETHVPAMVVSDNCSIKSFEHLLAAPAHFRASIKTKYVNQFTQYVNNNGTPETAVFIDNDSLNAIAIIDMGDQGDPAWGHHRAQLSLLKEDDYQALLRFNVKKLSQADMIDFIEDWPTNIEFYATEKKISLNDAVSRIRRIKITANKEQQSNQGDFNQSHSALESIEINSDSNILPDSFIFTCRPFAELPIKTIHCKIRAHTGDGIKLSYRITAESALQKELTDDFVEILKSGIAVKNSITIGNIVYQ